MACFTYINYQIQDDASQATYFKKRSAEEVVAQSGEKHSLEFKCAQIQRQLCWIFGSQNWDNNRQCKVAWILKNPHDPPFPCSSMLIKQTYMESTKLVHENCKEVEVKWGWCTPLSLSSFVNNKSITSTQAKITESQLVAKARKECFQKSNNNENEEVLVFKNKENEKLRMTRKWVVEEIDKITILGEPVALE